MWCGITCWWKANSQAVLRIQRQCKHFARAVGNHFMLECAACAQQAFKQKQGLLCKSLRLLFAQDILHFLEAGDSADRRLRGTAELQALWTWSLSGRDYLQFMQNCSRVRWFFKENPLGSSRQPFYGFCPRTLPGLIHICGLNSACCAHLPRTLLLDLDNLLETLKPMQIEHRSVSSESHGVSEGYSCGCLTMWRKSRTEGLKKMMFLKMAAPIEFFVVELVIVSMVAEGQEIRRARPQAHQMAALFWRQPKKPRRKRFVVPFWASEFRIATSMLSLFQLDSRQRTFGHFCSSLSRSCVLRRLDISWPCALYRQWLFSFTPCYAQLLGLLSSWTVCTSWSLAAASWDIEFFVVCICIIPWTRPRSWAVRRAAADGGSSIWASKQRQGCKMRWLCVWGTPVFK